MINIVLFRNELLSELYNHKGERVVINSIIDKYTNGATEFDVSDSTPPIIRIDINSVLLELKKLGWITLDPRYGLMSGHKINLVTGKFEFEHYETIYAKLTTMGESEYKKSFVSPWYKHWLMKYLVYPVLAGLIIWWITSSHLSK